jgi:eukaryotic-like serine/threonine-protein kinase
LSFARGASRSLEMSGANEPVQSEERPIDGRYLPGEIVDGKYRLVRPLGRGGVGRVWVAHHLVLDVQVGLKIIHGDAEGGAHQGARLLQEARAAARLGHPAIVRIFDFGETRHRDPFVAMELLSGETLADALGRQGRMPAIRAIQLMLPIADALAVAHAKGVVHRDVKPENIFLARDEAGRTQPKLLDFGIARVESNLELTLQGVVLGTPQYMSPEQARGDSGVDQRTDIWSFCVVLYELTAGCLPFSGENYNALLQAIIHQQPVSLSTLAAGDRELWQLLERGLQKEPSDRWETMRALGEALAGWLYERGVREDACAASLKTSWLESAPTEPDSAGPTTVPPRSERRETTQQPGSRPRTGSPALRLRVAVIGLAALMGFAAAGYAFVRTQAARGAGAPAIATAHEIPKLAPAELGPPPLAPRAEPGTLPGGSEKTPPSADKPRREPRLAPARSGSPRRPSTPKEYDFGF